MSVLLALAAVGIVAAFSMHEEPRPVVYTNSAVKAVSPKPGEGTTQDATVFIELQPGFALRTLRFDNSEQIAAEDLDVIAGLNRYSFTPGEGKQIVRLDAGRTCAEVEFADTVAPTASLQTFSWCFDVQV